jgi:HlyD family secretion protein
MKRQRLILPVLVVLVAAAIYFLVERRPGPIVLTGIVTTDETIVSSEVQGRLQQLSVGPGDTVKAGDLLGMIAPQEATADVAFYANSEKGAEAQVTQAEADLKYQEATTAAQISQAEANLASVQAQAAQAVAAAEYAQLLSAHETKLLQDGAESQQAADQARTGNDSAKALVESFQKQVLAARSALDLAHAGAQQVAVRRAAIEASRQQQAALGSQQDKAKVQLGYTEIHSPIAGVVDVRAALQGEVVNPGQAIVTVIDPDALWVRVDVEESFIDGIHLGDKLTVRLPSGAEREGTVFFRGVDADYATQRDVSRTKRDIKTFEVRLRCDNRDRSLAVGMTAYVILPPPR